jgi:hypothetical protein
MLLPTSVVEGGNASDLPITFAKAAIYLVNWSPNMDVFNNGLVSPRYVEGADSASTNGTVVVVVMSNVLAEADSSFDLCTTAWQPAYST